MTIPFHCRRRSSFSCRMSVQRCWRGYSRFDVMDYNYRGRVRL
jgi:hypothetical protein